MTRYALLLRAVNVGGANRIAMKDLATALADAGLEEVRTLLQSGNVLCASDRREAGVTALAEAAIRDGFGLEVTVVVRSAAELARVAASSPFGAPGEELDPTTLHVAFFTAAPTKDAAAVDQSRYAPDAFVVAGRDAYISYPNGSGRSKLTLAALERDLGVPGTARNWSTVQRLAELAGST